MSLDPKIQSSSKTRLYETLGVKKNATESDLKQAYRKRSLEGPYKHPDKGGNPEKFKEMKFAYESLMDKRKRRVNDWFGDVGVQVFDSGSVFNMSPSNLLQIASSIDICDRLLILMALVVCLGYLLLFPILLSIRWDHPHSMSFAHVFIPVWLGLSSILVCSVCGIVGTISTEIEDDSSEEKEMIEKRRVNIFCTILITGLLTLLILLVLRLDGHTDWSYFWVIWPWILLELLIFVACIEYAVVDHRKRDSHRRQSPLELVVQIAIASCRIFHMIFACNVAWKMDGTTTSWWTVFWPIWVSIAIGLILQCCRGHLFVEPDSVTADPEVREEMFAKKEDILRSIFFLFVWLGCSLLLCWKLSHPNAFPAFVIFLPLFCFGGCICCLLTCVICCGPDIATMIIEKKPDMTASESASPLGGTTYNTMQEHP